jgi:hypothetical protein
MRERLLTFGLALLAMLLLVGLLSPPKPKVQQTRAASVDEGNLGLSVFYHYLQAQKLPVASNRLPWTKLNQYGSGHVLLSSAPYTQQNEQDGKFSPAAKRYVTLSESRAMLRWIAAGNTLVLTEALADRDQVRELELNEDVLPRLGWQLSNAELESEILSAQYGGGDSNLSTASEPQALHRLQLLRANAPPLAMDYLAWEPMDRSAFELSAISDCSPTPADETIDDESADDETVDDADQASTEADQTEQVLKQRSGSTQQAAEGSERDEAIASADESDDAEQASDATETITCAEPGLNQAVPLLRTLDGDHTFAWVIPVGKGFVVSMVYGRLFSNRNIEQAGVADVGSALLASFLKPGGAIWFDDYRYGLSAIYDPAALFADARLYWTLAICLALWLAYVLGRSNRMLAPRPAHQWPSNTPLTLQAAALFKRSLAPSVIREALLEHFLKTHGLPADTASELAWQRLAQRFGTAEIRAVRNELDPNQLLLQLQSLEQTLQTKEAL